MKIFCSRLFLLCCFFSVIYGLLAQKQTSNWIFNGFQLEFSDDTVTVVPNSVVNNISNGYTSISDSAGNLIIYTDSFTLWDKNNEKVPNGSNLLLPSMMANRNIQSLIVPKPGSETVYYIFTANPVRNNPASGLYYSTVDMSLNGGLGEVTGKGIRLVDSTSNRITAAYHSNRNDIWVLAHQDFSEIYYSCESRVKNQINKRGS